MQRSWVVTITLCVAGMVATLQGTHGSMPAAVTQAARGDNSAGHVTMPAQLTWSEAPPALPRGAKAVVLYGDPGAASGTFTIRLKMPDGYKVMPHTHPTDEFVTVLSGALRVGMSRQWDNASMKEMPAGGFAHMPAETAHYVQAHGETLIQVSGQSPFTLTYIDPKDDPRKDKPSSSASR